MRVDFRRHVALVEHGAPGDVAGVVRLAAGQELLAHRRAAAVGADQEIAALARAVGEDRGDAAFVLLDAGRATCRDDSYPAGMQVAQRAEHPAPRAHHADGVAPVVGAAVVVEEHDAVDADAHRIVERDAEPLA